MKNLFHKVLKEII